MQIFFDHILCQQSDKDLIFVLVSAYFEECEYDYALDNGWIPFNSWYDSDSKFVKNSLEDKKDIWVQARSSRINVKKFTPNKKQKKLLQNNIDTKLINSEDLNPKNIYDIYNKYCKYRNFEDVKNYNEFKESCFSNDLKYICYFINNNLIGYCIVQFISNQMLSHQFCWDYEEPKLSLGTFSQIKEIEIAKSLNKEYVYIGAIAEKHGIYKTKFTGFEFWTGRKWESETKNLIHILESESNITTVNQMSNLISDYIKLFDI